MTRFDEVEIFRYNIVHSRDPHDDDQVDYRVNWLVEHLGLETFVPDPETGSEAWLGTDKAGRKLVLAVYPGLNIYSLTNASRNVPTTTLVLTVQVPFKEV